jgi:hypothetical protein
VPGLPSSASGGAAAPLHYGQLVAQDQDSRHAQGSPFLAAAFHARYDDLEVAGGYTGRVTGMYAAAETMRFDWFDYEPLGG